MITKILVVEDSPLQLDAAEQAILTISEAQKRAYSIGVLQIDKADCATAARQFLEAAARDRLPYDILLLDLGLPENRGEDDNAERGFQIIELARATGAAKAITVISAFTEHDCVSRAFLKGATDFIGKPYSKDEMQIRVLNAWARAREEYLRKIIDERMKERAAILDERIRELAPYAERGVAQRFNDCFSQLIKSVGYETASLGEELGWRFNLRIGESSQDSIAQKLCAIEQSARAAEDEWNSLQGSLKSGSIAASRIIVEDALREIVESLRLCLNVQLDESLNRQTSALSFKDGVRTVLKEILVGGLSEVADLSAPRTTDVKIAVTGVMAEVVFADNFPALAAEDASAINEGKSIPPRDASWRAWGLSIVQQIAISGGGRLIVESGAGGAGNTITYQIPLA